MFMLKLENGMKISNEIKKQALEQIKSDAINDGILDKAKESGLKKLQEMFKSFGYNEVIINTIQ